MPAFSSVLFCSAHSYDLLFHNKLQTHFSSLGLKALLLSIALLQHSPVEEELELDVKYRSCNSSRNPRGEKRISEEHVVLQHHTNTGRDGAWAWAGRTIRWKRSRRLAGQAILRVHHTMSRLLGSSSLESSLNPISKKSSHSLPCLLNSRTVSP